MILAGQPSFEVAQRYLLDLRDTLEAMRDGSVTRMESVVWPAGLDRTILQALPLRIRTRNCLQRECLMQGNDPLTVQELLRIPNFGHRSLGDLLFTVEGFLEECIRTGRTVSPESSESGGGASKILKETDAPKARTEMTSITWESVGQLLIPLLAVAAELRGTKTLADVLSPEFVHLADRMGVACEIRGIRINHLAGGTPSLVSVIVNRVVMTIDAASEIERKVVEHRLLRTPPLTLEDVGSQVGVTRERIRQIQSRIGNRVRDALGEGMRVIALEMRDGLGHLVKQEKVERRIDALLPPDHGLATRLVRKALIDEMGFTLDDGVYLDERATQELDNIRTTIRNLADDVGLVNKQQVMEILPTEEWQQFWLWACKRIGIHNLHGMLGLRDSAQARAKAALLSIGRPATRKEIGSVCGFEEGRVGTFLSNIPSVIRADKQRWGLREWIDDEYDGIIGEIIQRIEEDGGATIIERLLTELPCKFGVNPMSVRSYLQTSKFVIRDGWISLASASSVQLKNLDDVIDGRDCSGAPYWRFTVEARFLNGYSVTGVPPEFAKALGCTPDAGKRVKIENLPRCRELSIRWPLASSTGASLGYLAEPLKLLNLRPSDCVRVTIRAPGLVELSADEGNGEDPQTSEAEAILKRMMRRRRVI